MKKILFCITLSIALNIISFQAGATKHVVNVSEFQFSPANIPSVLVGDTIRWVWINGSHTTTSTSVPQFANTWDNPINNSNTSFEYRVVVAGTYQYVCTPHAPGMAGSFTAFEFTDVPPVMVQTRDFNFFPNPVKESLTVSFNNEATENGFVKIFDMQGKEVLHQPIQVTAGTNTVEMSVAVLNKGFYMVEVFAGDHKVGMKKMNKE